MSPKRKITAKDIVADLRSGLTDPELMTKYRLTSRGLQSVFRKLLSAQLITWDEVYGRSGQGDDTVLVTGLRRLTRGYPALSVSVYDMNDPDQRGLIRNITQQGLGILGIETEAGQVRNFVIQAEEFLETEPIELEAICRWARREGPLGDYISGFEIISISSTSLEALAKLIELITFTFDE
jgi:hypothetical protein